MKCPNCDNELTETKFVNLGERSYYCVACGYKALLYKHNNYGTFNRQRRFNSGDKEKI